MTSNLADSSTIEQPSKSTNDCSRIPKQFFGQPFLHQILTTPMPAPLAGALGAAGVAVVAGIIGAVIRRKASKKRIDSSAAVSAEPVAEVATDSIANPPQAPDAAVDLSPFGSPVGSTPVRIPPLKRRDKTVAPAASSEAPTPTARSEVPDDDQSDNASVRDQRQTQPLVDAAQLQKTLKQMQEMAEENRKLSAFLAEYKADAEKLSKLEEENRALRDVTRQLEQEMQELKVSTMPRTGAELEMFKSNLHAPPVARSVYSTDDPAGLGISTASVDGVHPETRARRNSLFKQLLASLQGTPSAGVSQAATPRSTSGGGHAPSTAAASSRQRKQPRPEEAAAIGQAVYQLLDSFGGRMM